MFRVSTLIAESYPPANRITRTSFLLNVQRFYSTYTLKKHSMSNPLYYFNFLTTLKQTRRLDVDVEIHSNDIREPTGRELMLEICERIKKDPYGMMGEALKYKLLEVKRGRVKERMSKNQVRQLCLQELYQQARVAIGLSRDRSNAKRCSMILWRSFLQASEEQKERTWPEVDEGLLNRYVHNQKRKIARRLHFFSETRVESKLRTLSRKLRRRISDSPRRRAISDLQLHARELEKEAMARDASVWAISTWNVDKNSSTVPNSARSVEVGIIPTATDVLLVSEASKYKQGGVRKPPTWFRQCTWTSSSIGTTQILVRHPHTLVAEVDVGRFPTPLITPDEEEEDCMINTAEMTVCKIRDGRVYRQLAAPGTLGSNDPAGEFFACATYLPPTPNIDKFREMIIHVKKVCDDLIRRPLPIVLAGDFNLDLLQGMPRTQSRDLAARKREVWSKIWRGFLTQHNCKMTLLHNTSEPSFLPTSVNMNESLLDAVYLIFKDDPAVLPLPTVGFFTPAPTQHSIVTGFFSLKGHSPATAAAPADKIGEHIKWDKVRYDVQLQDELRASLQAKILKAGKLKVSTLTDLISATAARKLGTSPPPREGLSSCSTVRTTRAGTQKRRAQAWNTRRLDSKAKAITRWRRKLEAVGKRFRRGRATAWFSGWKLHLLGNTLRDIRSSLRSAVESFCKEVKVTRQRYYDEANRHLKTDCVWMISQSHKIRRRVFKMRQPRNCVAHDAQTLNREWQRILNGGDEAERPNEGWLRDQTQGILERAAIDHERIEIKVDSVCKALSRIKNGKAPGIDGIANEGLKLIAGMEEAAIAKIAALFEEIVNEPNTDEVSRLKAGLLVLIPKETENEDEPKPTDYRPISLLPHLAKLLELVVMVTIEEEYGLDRRLSPQQYGFRRHSGTADAQINLRALHELCDEKGHPLLVVLLDIKKAFDSVPFDVIACSLDRLGIPATMIRFLRSWVAGQKRRIVVEGNNDDAWLSVKRGVPQGSSLSPILFAAVMDTLDGFLKGESVLGAERIEAEVLPQRLEVAQWLTQMYADDTVLFGHSIENVNRSLGHIRTWAKYAGLTCHPGKFKLLRLGSRTLRYSSGNIASTDAAEAPGKYIAADAGDQGKMRCMSVTKIDGAVKFGDTVIPLAHSAKYLGIDLLGWKSSKRAGVTQVAALASRVEHRLTPARANIEAVKFAFRVGDKACNVHFASSLHRSVAEGLYFGVETSATSEQQLKRIRTVVGIAAKASLGMHKSTSTVSALKFVGWQEPAVAIVLRTLRLLRKKAIAPDAAEGELLDPPAMLIAADGGVHTTLSPFMSDLRSRLTKLIGHEKVAVHFPESGAAWKRNMLADRQKRLGITPPENSPSASADINALIKAVKECDVYNHQHPIVRVAREHAFAAFKFTCFSLIPFRRPGQQPLLDTPDKCELCGEEGIPTGFHLLTSCSHRRCRAIMAGILSDEDIAAWKAGRESDDDDAYSLVNRIIERDNPTLIWADDKVKSLILVRRPNNDLDVLARLLTRELRDSTIIDGVRKWKHDDLVRRGGDIERYRINGEGGKWSSINAEKELLYTAYRWTAKLCYQLWKVGSEEYRANRATTTAATRQH